LYLLHNLSHQVLRHVSEPQVLESAIRAMAWQLDWPREDPVFGRYDPVELDTYANLLDRRAARRKHSNGRSRRLR
jgi:hypothetical protein